MDTKVPSWKGENQFSIYEIKRRNSTSRAEWFAYSTHNVQVKRIWFVGCLFEALREQWELVLIMCLNWSSSNCFCSTASKARTLIWINHPQWRLNNLSIFVYFSFSNFILCISKTKTFLIGLQHLLLSYFNSQENLFAQNAPTKSSIST